MQKVTEELVKRRLDLVIVLLFPSYSRTKARELLNLGAVKVNGVVEYRPNYKVALNDEIEVTVQEGESSRHLKPTKGNIEIVYQDEDLLAVNKPFGLKVHPVASRDTDSLLNVLYYQLGDKVTNYGLSLINRIDKETSGLVLVALSPKGAWHYAMQFEQSKAIKTYLAVVSASWRNKYLEKVITVRNFLADDREHHKQQVVLTSKKGKYAVTAFKQIAVKEDMALLTAEPQTGRTHQIRVQLETLEFPILGDTVYGGETYPRLCLHAYKLKIEKPDGSLLELVAEPDASFPFSLSDIE